MSKELIFENTDLRHQIFTQAVNLAFFNDGDKNTAILDEDATLSGFQVIDKDGNLLRDARRFPISLNNLEFNRSSNAVNECLSEGQQDTAAEDRPTSLMSPADMASLEFQVLSPLRQDVTFTKDSLDYTGHQAMTLVTGRDGRGTWEPKVASGFGYTIKAARGVPNVVHIGLTDPVKPDIVAPTGPGDPGKNPFFVRVGICFQSKNQPVHPADATKFTIKRGYRSWGGNGTSFNDSELQRYFVHLDQDHTVDGQHCINLDDANPTNLSDTVKGCPVQGVTGAPDGGCPYPSTKQTVGSAGNMFTACVYPTSLLTKADTIQDLKTVEQRPDPTKYFYDPKTGWLFFYVLQEFPNPIAGSPLGSCSAAGGSSSDDPSCPDVAHKESFYACPAQGCVDYVVRLNDPTYDQDASKCPDPYTNVPSYAQDPPPSQNQLAYVGAPDNGKAIVPVEKISRKGFLHTAALKGDPSSCK